MSDAAAARWMRWCVAFIWLWTGLGVLHPYYREKGAFYLAPLGLPAWVMWVTCAGEVALAVWVALRKSSTWLTLLQVATILTFTLILFYSDVELLFHPQGVLTKNLPIIGLIVAAWFLEGEKKGLKDAYYILVFVLIVFWWLDLFFTSFDKNCYVLILEFAFPFVYLLGVVLGSDRILMVYSIPLVLLILGLTLMTSWEEPLLWFHPFGPLSKNVAILGVTVIGPWVAGQYLRSRRGIST
jgi:hypothetical protein